MTESRKEGLMSRERENETRETEKRDTPWKPAPLLPNPNPREGLDFRYVRVSMRGEADNVNVSQALRDGWEPVLSADYPELKVVSDRGSDYPDNVVVGGLLLCSRPSEIGEQIDSHREREVGSQMEAVDRNYFREQDPRMPMLQPERRTKITFGDN
jgi:hypothetical protein